MQFKQRKRIRLKGYDYSQNGAYFITICTYKRQEVLSDVVDVGQGLCSCRLNNIGDIVEDELMKLQKRYSDIKIDKFVIMPNHIHFILCLDYNGQEQSPCPTVGDIICTLKSISTKRCNKFFNTPGQKIWQYRFNDHIIRNENEYKKISEYIDNNPSSWCTDCFYSD